MWNRYTSKKVNELRPYVPGEDLTGVSISGADRQNGSPKIGDMICRNPKNHADVWLVAEQYFKDSYEVTDGQKVNLDNIDTTVIPPTVATEETRSVLRDWQYLVVSLQLYQLVADNGLFLRMSGSGGSGGITSVYMVLLRKEDREWLYDTHSLSDMLTFVKAYVAGRTERE